MGLPDRSLGVSEPSSLFRQTDEQQLVLFLLEESQLHLQVEIYSRPTAPIGFPLPTAGVPLRLPVGCLTLSPAAIC